MCATCAQGCSRFGLPFPATPVFGPAACLCVVGLAFQKVATFHFGGIVVDFSEAACRRQPRGHRGLALLQHSGKVSRSVRPSCLGPSRRASFASLWRPLSRTALVAGPVATRNAELRKRGRQPRIILIQGISGIATRVFRYAGLGLPTSGLHLADTQLVIRRWQRGNML